jgi:hypothetical protein
MSYIPPTTAGWTSQKFGTNPGGYNPAGGHTGEDIAVPIGTPLVAMADGVVVHVGPFTGTYTDNPWWIMPSFAGFVVTVDYGEYLSHYAHCSGSPVLSGRRVSQGEVVAYSGNSGGATSGPHVHWEVMRNGWNLQSSTYGRINPRSIIGPQIAAQGTTTPQEDDDMALFADRDAFKAAVVEAVFGARYDTRDETNKVTGTITLKDLLTYYPANVALDRKQITDGLTASVASVVKAVKAGQAVDPVAVAKEIAAELDGITLKVVTEGAK